VIYNKIYLKIYLKNNHVFDMNSYIKIYKYNIYIMSKFKVDIVNLLKKGNHNDIKKNLFEEIAKISVFCDQTVGEGYFGKVRIPSVGPYMNVLIDEQYITLPIVIKESKHKGSVNIESVNKNLIIYSDNCLTSEALILFILSKHWYEEKNLHLPFMLAAGGCDVGEYHKISNIILEKNGLPERILIDYRDVVRDPLHLNNADLNGYETSFMATIFDLCKFMSYNYDEKYMCVLPNGKTANVVNIIDNICIFFLHTAEYLWKNCGVTLSDQHLNNIFIHWQNSSSYCGKRNTHEIKYINYELKKNKYMTVETHGMIFKIGDVGTCHMKTQKDVIIVGDLADGDKLKLEKTLIYKNRHKLYMTTINRIIELMPADISTKTKIYKVIKSNKYTSRYSLFHYFKEKDHKNLPCEIDILNDDIYLDMCSNKLIDNKENFHVKLDVDI